MTNDQYRKSRGTHRKFRTTRKEANRIWREMNKDAIEKKKAEQLRARKLGRRLRGDVAADEEE